ncbi:hypothetical protein C2862_04130 [Massilia sp. Mn16-1_5]|nr:hypothetical protein C2862_04130 [Massilia sp. Mn16-1_5]
MPIPTELLVKITSKLAPDDGPATAEDALHVWRTLFGKLAPLLGPLSTELMFARSLAARQPAFPWLPRLAPDAEPAAFSRFAPCLDGRSPDDILAANRVLLETFTSALAELIGVPLATRLLHAAFPDDDANKNTLEKSA